MGPHRSSTPHSTTTLPPRSPSPGQLDLRAQAAQDRELRKSIDKESAIRDQIQGLTDQVRAPPQMGVTPARAAAAASHETLL